MDWISLENRRKYADRYTQMKIAMVTPFFSPLIGGTEVFVEKISSKLNEKGVLTDILTFDCGSTSAFSDENRENVNRSKVVRVPALNLPTSRLRTHLLNVNYIPKKRLSLLKEYDIIHFHNETDLSFPLFSYPIRKPKVFHCHTLGANFGYYRMNPVSTYVLKKTAHRYVAVSNYVASLLEELGISSRRIVTVHNGVDIGKFRPSSTDRTENLLLFVGRLDPSKGLHHLLRSLEILSDPVELVIAGPLSWDDTYNSKIFSLIRKVSNSTIHKIAYLGEQKQDNLIGLYRKAAILVLPSVAESLGLVILEAMACGTAVIASNTGGIPEIVEDNINGLLFRPGDVTELAKKIQYLLQDRKMRMQLGNEGRRSIVSNFSCDSTVDKLLRVYKEMI